MRNLTQRIAKLEVKMPRMPLSSAMVALSELDPGVAAILVARNCDVEQMTLSELDALEAELRRFTD